MRRAATAAGAVALLAVAGGGWYMAPRPVRETLAGVQYRTGHPGARTVRVTVAVRGTVWRALDGAQTFRGILRLTGATRPNPDNDRPLTVHFGPDGLGVMAYAYYTDGRGIVRAYGVLFAGGGLRDIVILVGNWSAADGLTIAAPATGRRQALRVSSALMKRWLNGYVLH